MKSMVQGSPEWLEWRLNGIGASDAPVIMGTSPWRTPYELYLEKVNRTIEYKSNPAMQRGNQLEPLVRDMVNKELKANFQPITLEMRDSTHIRASLDGLDGDKALEIKCPNKEDHELAAQGKVPEKYIYQLVCQSLVSGLNEIIYASYHDGDLALVLYQPLLMQKIELKLAIDNFWFEHVQKKVPPPLTDRDQVELNTVEATVDFGEYIDLKNKEKTYAFMAEQKKNELIFKYGSIHPKVICNGITLSKVDRIGAVDYKKIPELKGVDLSQYRGPSKSYYLIKDGSE